MPEACEMKMPSILETVDEFVACVPWGKWVAILIYKRMHAGRVWLTMRRWNRHRKKLCWYPTKRYFVVPMADASGLATAILSGVNGKFEAKPDWLVEREEAESLIERPRRRPRARATA